MRIVPLWRYLARTRTPSGPDFRPTGAKHAERTAKRLMIRGILSLAGEGRDDTGDTPTLLPRRDDRSAHPSARDKPPAIRAAER